MTPTAFAAGFLLLTAVLGAIGAWVRWIRPRWRKARAKWIAAQDAIIGRDAVVDSITGKELAPALPGMGQRMASMEQAIASMAQQRQEIDELKSEVADHRNRIASLEDARTERIVAHAESASAFRAIETAIKATPDPEGDVVDDQPDEGPVGE